MLARSSFEKPLWDVLRTNKARRERIGQVNLWCCPQRVCVDSSRTASESVCGQEVRGRSRH